MCFDEITGILQAMEFDTRGVIGTLSSSLRFLNPGISLREKKRRWAVYTSTRFRLRNFGDSPIFADRELMWDYVFTKYLDSEEGHGLLIEFGVWEGYSVNYFSSLRPNWCIYGLDSFFGLEEKWIGTEWAAGSFTLHGKMPDVGKNVILIDGWFEDTVPELIKVIGSQQIDLLHLDADTFTPTALVLKALGKVHLKIGSIVIFDEFFGYAGWKRHEYKAWMEFLSQSKRDFSYIASAPNQVAIRIDS